VAQCGLAPVAVGSWFGSLDPAAAYCGATPPAGAMDPASVPFLSPHRHEAAAALATLNTPVGTGTRTRRRDLATGQSPHRAPSDEIPVGGATSDGVAVALASAYSQDVVQGRHARIARRRRSGRHRRRGVRGRQVRGDHTSRSFSAVGHQCAGNASACRDRLAARSRSPSLPSPDSRH